MKWFWRQTYGRRGLTAALLTGVVLGWVSGQVLEPDAALAQGQVLPNSAAQRYDMVSELKAMNARLASIEGFLRSGELTVVVQEKGETKPPRAER
ncbi:MAG: hypothetical protein JSU68_10460 [Phycisphaerales bacterium]|nr:MAG: hypothetical protein JSU68_10460 [Phycisphaerales bacterium]